MVQVSKVYLDSIMETFSIEYLTGVLGKTQKFITGEKIELMQYTGLKDRVNGEIYENDIISDEDGQRFTVVFWDDYGQWWAEERTGEWSMSLGELIGECVVIGNSYQNPELLELPPQQEENK